MEIILRDFILSFEISGLIIHVPIISLDKKCMINQSINSLVVNTTQGPVRGYRGSDADYFAFLGIPYATEPTGRDKFKAPLPGPSWEEPFEATDGTIVCPQLPSDAMPNANQQVNCLVANVYTPITNETNLPVVVVVHGGSFLQGTANALSPKVLVTRGNIIYVKFNYRLGFHGFLCLGTEQIPGNAGMKDMIALLRWVNVNIASFGGNPNDVTINGYSAGGASVDLLMLSPLSRGLFHKVIPESGNGLAVWSVQQDPFENAKSFAQLSGFTSDDVYELEDYFTGLSREEVVSLLYNVQFFNDSTVRTAPCVEREIDGVESFMTDSPLNILQRGEYPKVPYLIGFTEAEGLMILDLFPERQIGMNTYFADYLPADLVFSSIQEKEEVARSIWEFYFSNETMTDENVYEYIGYFGDVTFPYPALRTVKLMANAGSDSIYLYEYTYFDPNIHSYSVPNSTVIVHGAAHTVQTFELFETVGFITDNFLSADNLRVRNTLRQFWINFVRTGSPLPEPTDEFPQGWPPATADSAPHMRIDNTTYLEGLLKPEEISFWDGIYDRYYLQPIPPPAHPPRNSGPKLLGGVVFALFNFIILVLLS